MLRRRIPFSMIALLLGMLAPGSVTVFAVQGFQPVSAAELKMTSEPLAPGAPAVILFRQMDRDDSGDTVREDSYYRIKILTEEGRRYGDIEIPYVSETGEVGSIHARTIKPDGTIVDFQGKAFDKTIVKGKGLKYLAKTFALPDVQVGGIIEYYYSYHYHSYLLYDARWILSDQLFTKDAKFSLKPDPHLSLRWLWHLLPAGAGDPAQDRSGIIRLEINNVPAFQSEDYMPPENEVKSRVDFIYSSEPFGNDANKFWAKLGKALDEYLQNFLGKRNAMEKAVAGIVSPDDPPETKLRKIYARVQQIRNLSYEQEKTQQEEKRSKEKEANTAEDIWKRGYGHGWAITWLYLALMRAAGFDAYGVAVSDRRHYFLDTSWMQTGSLNGNVVMIKLQGKELFLDPGSAFTPFGLLPWPETGVEGLRLDKGHTDWVRTTLPDSSESLIKREAHFQLLDTGDLEGKLTVTATGLKAMDLRVEERHEDEAARKKFLEEEVQAFIPLASEVELTNKPDWNSSALTLVAQFNVRVPAWATTAGYRVLLSPGIFSNAQKHTFDHAARVHPIYIEYPFEELDDISVEIPAAWKIDTLPPRQGNSGNYVGYSIEVVKDGAKVHIYRTFNMRFLLLDTSHYETLRHFFQTVRTGDEQQIVLLSGATSVQN